MAPAPMQARLWPSQGDLSLDPHVTGAAAMCPGEAGTARSGTNVYSFLHPSLRHTESIHNVLTELNYFSEILTETDCPPF